MKKNTERLVIRDGVDIQRAVSRMASLRWQIKQAKALIEEGKDAITKYMSLHNMTRISNDVFYVTVSEYTSTTFDTAQFRAEHPTLYKKYLIHETKTRFTYGAVDHE